MRSSSGSGFGTSFLLFALSAISGAAVTLFLIVSFSPLVALFPPASGAQEIAYAIAVMWGVVVAATVAVLSIGSYRRRQIRDVYDARWQERYVPVAPTSADRGEFGAGAYRRTPVALGDATPPAFDARLRQMDALMAANRALVERLERAATPTARPDIQVTPLRPATARPQPRAVPKPAQSLRAYR